MIGCSIPSRSQRGVRTAPAYRRAYHRPIGIDATTTASIACPRARVSAYAADPDNAPEWYSNIERIRWLTPRPLATGSRVEFVARFLGRHLTYVYEFRVWEPGERLVMATDEGPFPMETTYVWEDAGGGATRMTLRNRGEPHGFSRLARPLLERAVERANRRDLERLKRILEAPEPT